MPIFQVEFIKISNIGNLRGRIIVNKSSKNQNLPINSIGRIYTKIEMELAFLKTLKNPGYF